MNIDEQNSIERPVSARETEEAFYLQYAWCLNPVLTLREVFLRIREELDRGNSVKPGWQRDEIMTNLYLLICAASCTLDDYLTPPPSGLFGLSRRIPILRGPIDLVHRTYSFMLNLRFIGIGRSVILWRRKWRQSVNQSCDWVLATLGKKGITRGDWDLFFQDTVRLLNVRLPESLMRRRIKIPEGFRCQDLTPQDVLFLGDRYIEAHPERKSPDLIIGIRTAGSYFAPLLRRYLQTLGWQSVKYMTVRPKHGLSLSEKRRIRESRRSRGRILIVDDHPNTGYTFSLLLKILKEEGIDSKQITILAPLHPAQKRWTEQILFEGNEPVEILTIAPSDYYKRSRLKESAVEPLFQEYFGSVIRIADPSALEGINSEFISQYGDGFQVRMKRVYRCEGTGTEGLPENGLILLKSVGWGWLGYHAYLAGLKLNGYVPKVIGLRDGFLIMAWLEGNSAAPDPAGYSPVRSFIPSYLAARSRLLRLSNPPFFESSEYKWSGWDDLLYLCRTAYGSSLIGWLKSGVLRKRLMKDLQFAPALIDGKVAPEEFIVTDGGAVKVDFEHHNFGGAELDLSDPAFDLASAIFEFRLSKESEIDLIDSYRMLSGDDSVSRRLFYYKLLYGFREIRNCAYKLNDSEKPGLEIWNQRYLRARNFLIYQMNERSARRIPVPRETTWSDKLFFLDLDGVFDREGFGRPLLPHTTGTGLHALSLLRDAGFSVVLNTGRSIEHVRNYCGTFGLAGGIAEFGSVFWDHVRQKEISLVKDESIEAMKQCREAAARLPGVFIDPGYRYSVRAFRYQGMRTRGLEADEMRKIAESLPEGALRKIARTEDSYFVAEGTHKGCGVRYLSETLGIPFESSGGMGDSHHDREMLGSVRFAFAPSNCSPVLRDLAREGKCLILDGSFQSGLLQAARFLARQAGRPDIPGLTRNPDSDLFDDLLQVSERSGIPKVLALFSGRV